MGDHTRNSGAAILFFFWPSRRLPGTVRCAVAVRVQRCARLAPIGPGSPARPEKQGGVPDSIPQSVPHPVRTRSPDSAARAPQSQLPRPRLRPTPAALPDPSLACYSRLKFFFFFLEPSRTFYTPSGPLRACFSAQLPAPYTPAPPATSFGAIFSPVLCVSLLRPIPHLLPPNFATSYTQLRRFQRIFYLVQMSPLCRVVSKSSFFACILINVQNLFKNESSLSAIPYYPFFLPTAVSRRPKRQLQHASARVPACS